MPFDVASRAYDRYIGRYSSEIAPRFVDFAGVTSGPVLDVGCGPGGLAAALAQRLGAAEVAAVDPSEPFVAACRERVPGSDVRLAAAEALPFASGSFQAVLSQLVLPFLRDPDLAAREMARVARAGGTVAACMFEANGFAMVRAFWDAALRFDRGAPDDARLPFRRPGELVGLWTRAGFREVEAGAFRVAARYDDFEDYWSPFAFRIGPAGEYLRTLPEPRRGAIRDACFEILGRPAGAFTLAADVIAVRGRTSREAFA